MGGRAIDSGAHPMSLPEVVAALLFVGVIAYAVFAGADFGSGVWDLTAGGDERGAPLRTLIDHVIGPVWEANHVWLVYVLVFLWTGFPAVFAAVCTTFFVPLSLAGLGIVARGSAFAFRKLAPNLATARLLGALFAMSSVATPFLFGCVVGGIAAGRVPASGDGDPWTSWTGPTSLVGGTLAVLTCAFLAATFLTREASLRGDDALTEWCRRRALGSGLAAGAVALAGIAPLRSDARTLFDGLTDTALPVILVSRRRGHDRAGGALGAPVGARSRRRRGGRVARWWPAGASDSTRGCSWAAPRSSSPRRRARRCGHW